MDRSTCIEQLASDILLHKKRYYSGQATIPDEVYDALEDELRRLDASHPVLSLVGYSLNEAADKVRHVPPMLSLEKSYELEDVLDFVRKYPCICMDKLDGMALSLEYGTDGSLVRASTRGSGTMGENVTEAIYHVGSIPKRLRLPPMEEGAVFEVRGEIFFPRSRFAEFEAEFDSYRNAVPGTFGRKDIEAAVPVLRTLGFCAYEALLRTADGSWVAPAREFGERFGLMATSYLLRMELLERLGFFSGYTTRLAERVSFETEEVLAQYVAERFGRARDYYIDGIVFRIEDDESWEALGATSHHPRGSLAFKQTGEVAVTRIEAIEQNVGRSGKVSFRARLEPVNLSGAKITYATLHNAEFIESGGYAPGARVRIKRSGEVIPAIIGLDEAPPSPFELPTACPCGYPLTRRGPDLFCLEKRPCIHKDHESLVHFVQNLEIMGISDKIIMKLREAGLVHEPRDLFLLKTDDFLQLEGFGAKSAENMVQAIQARRQIPLSTFLTALGISRGGAVKCREVARRFGTLAGVRSATLEEIDSMRGWATKTAAEFINSLIEKRELIDNLLSVVEVLPEAQVAEPSGHPLAGKSVCITGALSRPREEYRDLLEKVGAKVSDGVSSKTAFLVCNEPSGSSKYRKAQELGIPVLNEEELLARL